MKLVIGGAFQGKTAYAKEAYGSGGWEDGKDCAFEALKDCRGVFAFHLYLRRLLEEKDYFGGDPAVLDKRAADFAGRLYKANPALIVVADELGCGIVPIEKNDRSWREFTGRVLSELAGLSDEVVRVLMGIPEKLK